MKIQIKKPFGFSIPEMLAVIALIVIIISILLPALSGARSASFDVKCSSRLHQLIVATRTFSVDDGGRLPAMQRVVQGAEFSWRGLMYEYTSKTPDVFDCPADEVQRYALAAFDDQGKPTAQETYLWSGLGAVNVHWNQGAKFRPAFGRWDPRYPHYGAGRAPLCRWAIVENSSQTILFGDGNSSYDSDGQLYYYQEDAFWIYKNHALGNPGYTRHNVSTMSGANERGLERHGNKYSANYAFADGTVRLVKSSEIECSANACWWDAQRDPH